ncbi:class II aldolase and Adducin N-terminal domain-containing protein [Aspergillus ambiguus]|uniref:class II aldolase/adducin family protein n=1 Tax=Aspergillus ambiguus TaxID=176160 RepID=UPI003CCCCA68
MEPTSVNDISPLDSTYRALILGCHILHHRGVLDAYGHISARHPVKKDTFLIPRNLAPALVSSTTDIVEYHVHDASPTHESPPGYIERFIHSEIYKRYPNVRSVVHSHSAEVLPYTITNVDLRPCVHMSGFLGNMVPKFDIAKYYQDGDVRDLLVRTSQLGEKLSQYYGHGSLRHPVVLMRGHGFSVVGESVEESVFRAVYTVENARIQTSAIALQNASGSRNGHAEEGIHYLHESELTGTTMMTQCSSTRPWDLWVREVESNSLYTNTIP